MDAKKRIDKILTAVHEQVQEEVAVLLGVKFSLSGASNVLATKAEFFDGLAGKQIVAKIDLSGEIEGLGCLVIGIKDAIRLGGTLIMLPDAELEEVVGREEYTGETEDSYGEIANIIAGSYTKMFEEMFSKSFRFIRKEQQILIPVKVDVPSDEPIPDQLYYQVSCSMKMEGRQMGEIHMLMPAVALGLQPEAVAEEQPEAETIPEAGVVPEVAEEVPVAKTEQAAEVKTATPDSTVTKKPVDPAKHKKRIDKLLGLCEKKLTDELSSLLSTEVTFSDIHNRLISKEELFFEELEGKQVVADMDVTGELQGKSYFLANLKGSIHLGGVLIMLPPSELENVVSREEFGEDVTDAYGEVANIVSGVYTSVFEEQYPEKIRFVKKGLQQVVPLKVDIASDDPMPDQKYYMSSMSMQADGTALGKVRMLFPANLLRLDEPAQPVAQTEPAQIRKEATPAQPEPAASQPVEEPHVAAAPARDPKFDVAKHRKRVDKLLKECGKKAQEEVGALLGTEILLDAMENRHVSKEDFFFEVAHGKQVVANLDVVGELEDRSYLFVSLKNAIQMGGVLIMLPPTELEAVVADEELSDDTRDAYGEIANIISGVYTAVFEEQYTRKLRFIRNDIGVVVPMKVDVGSDEPIPDIEYYMSSMSLSIEGQLQGKIHLLFPAGMLQLETVPEEVATVQQDDPGDRVRKIVGTDHIPVDILVISDDEVESSKLAAVAEASGFCIRQISLKDNIKGAITTELKAVYLVMRDVDEQAFGVAIKVSSSCSVPLIAAGPDWTRSKVIKAVKYGVNDILLTPATPEDIRENLDNNLVQMAA